MLLTVALAVDIVAEVIRHMSSLPVTLPTPYGGSWRGLSCVGSGRLKAVPALCCACWPYPFKVYRHTNYVPPLHTFDMVSQLDKLRVGHNEGFIVQEPETPSLGPRVSLDM